MLALSHGVAWPGEGRREGNGAHEDVRLVVRCALRNVSLLFFFFAFEDFYFFNVLRVAERGYVELEHLLVAAFVLNEALIQPFPRFKF